MRAGKSKVTPDRKRALILISLAALCAVSSGCAGTPRHIAPDSPAPTILLTEGQRNSLCTDGLRGRLPDPDDMHVGDALAGWVSAEAVAMCERDRGDGMVRVVDEFTARWEAWLETRRP